MRTWNASQSGYQKFELFPILMITAWWWRENGKRLQTYLRGTWPLRTCLSGPSVRCEGGTYVHKFNCTDIKHVRAYVSSADSLRELHFSSFLRRSQQAGAAFLLPSNIEPIMLRSSDGISTEKNSFSEGLNGNSGKWRTAAQRAKWFRKIHDHIQTINHLKSDYTETPDIAPLSILIPGMHDFSR